MTATERSLSIASDGLTLEAMLHIPSSGEPSGMVVVCHPHPQRGGSMANNVVAALCDAALQEGMAALRFNFRGVGASGGAYEGGDGESRDVLAALDLAGTLPGGGVIGLAGYSFGASMAQAACAQGRAAPRALVLVSLPLRALAGSQLEAGPPNRLLIAGDCDPVCPSAELEAVAESLSPPADCTIITGADHSWFGYEAELRDAVAGFLRWHVRGI